MKSLKRESDPDRDTLKLDTLDISKKKDTNPFQLLDRISERVYTSDIEFNR